jgi:hypothetical protein
MDVHTLNMMCLNTEASLKNLIDHNEDLKKVTSDSKYSNLIIDIFNRVEEVEILVLKETSKIQNY